MIKKKKSKQGQDVAPRGSGEAWDLLGFALLMYRPLKGKEGPGFLVGEELSKVLKYRERGFRGKESNRNSLSFHVPGELTLGKSTKGIWG